MDSAETAATTPAALSEGHPQSPAADSPKSETSQDTDFMEDNIHSLIALAQKRFGKLKPAEETLLSHAAAGEPANFWRHEDRKPLDAEQVKTWGDDRTIRADLLAWLYTDIEANDHLTFKGFNVIGAKVAGNLDLQFATSYHCIRLSRCFLPESMLANDASIPGIYLHCCITGAIIFVRANVRGDVQLWDGFHAKSNVDLTGTTIGGSLSCSGGTFEDENGNALSADRMVVTGSVFFKDGFHAKGGVRLLGSSIGSTLQCTDGIFENENGNALSADGMAVKGSVFLSDGFHAKGGVRLLGSSIGGNLECTDGIFENENGNALSADRMVVTGSVFFKDGFHAKGAVRLLGSSIGSNLQCTDGTFENDNGDALTADRMAVTGDVLFKDGFHAKGEIRLLGSSIGGNLQCTDGIFENENGDALSADGMAVKGSVFLNEGFHAKGAVRLLGSSIGNNLECTGGTFENENGNALSADGMTVKGNMFINEIFHAKGNVSLPGVIINGTLSLNNSILDRTIDLSGAKVDGRLQLKNVSFSEATQINLECVRLGILDDDCASWPKKFIINGFTYGNLAKSATRDLTERLEWLKRQIEFHPQPYEQLASALKMEGNDRLARKVLIEKNIVGRTEQLQFSHWRQDLYKLLRDMGSLSLNPLRWTLRFIWNWLLRLLIGYGYEPWRAVYWAIPIVLVGALVFKSADTNGIMVPANAKEYDQSISGASHEDSKHYKYQPFSPIIYSLDTFLPIVSLHQEEYWLPDPTIKKDFLFGIERVGVLARWYLWFHALAGWVIASFLVAGVTGLVKR